MLEWRRRFGLRSRDEHRETPWANRLNLGNVAWPDTCW
jgi:hypothetical protein